MNSLFFVIVVDVVDVVLRFRINYTSCEIHRRLNYGNRGGDARSDICVKQTGNEIIGHVGEEQRRQKRGAHFYIIISK
jgi:hypothetical protein